MNVKDVYFGKSDLKNKQNVRVEMEFVLTSTI